MRGDIAIEEEKPKLLSFLFFPSRFSYRRKYPIDRGYSASGVYLLDSVWGSDRAGHEDGALEEKKWWWVVFLVRQTEKRTRVPESAMEGGGGCEAGVAEMKG